MKDTVDRFKVKCTYNSEDKCYSVTFNVNSESITLTVNIRDRCIKTSISNVIKLAMQHNRVFTLYQKEDATNKTDEETTFYVHFADDTESHVPGKSKVFCLANPELLCLKRNQKLSLATLLTGSSSDPERIISYFTNDTDTISVLRLLNIDSNFLVVQMLVSKFDTGDTTLLNVIDLIMTRACGTGHTSKSVAIHHKNVKYTEGCLKDNLVSFYNILPIGFPGNIYFENAFLFLLFITLQSFHKNTITNDYLNKLLRFAASNFEVIFLILFHATCHGDSSLYIEYLQDFIISIANTYSESCKNDADIRELVDEIDAMIRYVQEKISSALETIQSTQGSLASFGFSSVDTNALLEPYVNNLYTILTEFYQYIIDSTLYKEHTDSDTMVQFLMAKSDLLDLERKYNTLSKIINTLQQNVENVISDMQDMVLSQTTFTEQVNPLQQLSQETRSDNTDLVEAVGQIQGTNRNISKKLKCICFAKSIFLLLTISIIAIFVSLAVGILGIFVKKNLIMIIAGFSVLGLAVIATFIFTACCIGISIKIYQIKKQKYQPLEEVQVEQPESAIQEQEQGETSESGSAIHEQEEASELGSELQEPGEISESGSAIHEPEEASELGSELQEPGEISESGSAIHEPEEASELGSELQEPGEISESGSAIHEQEEASELGMTTKTRLITLLRYNMQDIGKLVLVNNHLILNPHRSINLSCQYTTSDNFTNGNNTLSLDLSMQ